MFRNHKTITEQTGDSIIDAFRVFINNKARSQQTGDRGTASFVVIKVLVDLLMRTVFVYASPFHP